MPISVQGHVRESSTKRPIPEVCVSNGESVVQTDKAGRFQLELDPEHHRFVFLTVPDGLEAVGDFYQTTATLKQSQDEIQFYLKPAPQRLCRSFVLAHITDTHLSDEEQTGVTVEVLTQDLHEIKRRSKADLVIVSGDLTDWGTLPQLQAYKRAIECSPMPIVSLYAGHDGNHERFGGATADDIVKLKNEQDFETLNRMIQKTQGQTHTLNFERIFGPTYYSFDWGGRHFVLWPNEAFFSENDLNSKATWLWSDLSLQPPDRPIIIVVHIPPAKDFLDQLNRYNVTAVLHGHWHSQKIFSYRQILVAATPALCFGAIDTTPRGYLQINFSSSDMTLQARPITSATSQTTSTQAHRRTPLTLDSTFDVCWQSQLPAAMHRAEPIYRNGKLFISLRDGSWPSQAGICCVDARDGTLRWHTKTEGSITNHVALSDSTNERESLCVAVSQTGRVYGLDANSGVNRWESDLPGFPLRWIYTSPVIADETVYVGAKGGYAALDLNSGQQHWYRAIKGGDSWSSYASPQVYHDLLIVHVNHGLMALNRHSGQIVWEQQLKIAYTYGSPVIAGEWVVNGGDWVNMHHPSGQNAKLLVLVAASGKIVWHRAVLRARYSTGIAVADETIYASTPDGGIQSYALKDGAMQWQVLTDEDLMDMTAYRRGDRSVLAAPTILNDMLLVGGCDGYLYALDRNSGTCIALANMKSPITAAVCVTDDGFCVGTHDGKLIAFSCIRR